MFAHSETPEEWYTACIKDSQCAVDEGSRKLAELISNLDQRLSVEERARAIESHNSKILKDIKTLRERYSKEATKQRWTSLAHLIDNEYSATFSIHAWRYYMYFCKTAEFKMFWLACLVGLWERISDVNVLLCTMRVEN